MRAKVYRNVEQRQEWLGLEPLDALALGALVWVLMLLHRQALGWNALVVACAWAGLRLFKRGRAAGFTSALVRFYVVRRPFFSAAAPDRAVAANPFRRNS
jgi:hypothetical protein